MKKPKRIPNFCHFGEDPDLRPVDMKPGEIWKEYSARRRAARIPVHPAVKEYLVSIGELPADYPVDNTPPDPERF